MYFKRFKFCFCRFWKVEPISWNNQLKTKQTDILMIKAIVKRIISDPDRPPGFADKKDHREFTCGLVLV